MFTNLVLSKKTSSGKAIWTVGGKSLQKRLLLLGARLIPSAAKLVPLLCWSPNSGIIAIWVGFHKSRHSNLHRRTCGQVMAVCLSLHSRWSCGMPCSWTSPPSWNFLLFHLSRRRRISVSVALLCAHCFWVIIGIKFWLELTKVFRLI